MQIFNIGPLELVFILLIALIVLGPDGMLKAARSIAKGMQKLIRSPIWKSMMSTTQEIRELPKKFMREAGIEESMEELNRMKNRFPVDDAVIMPPVPVGGKSAKPKESLKGDTPTPRDPNEASIDGSPAPIASDPAIEEESVEDIAKEKLSPKDPID